MKRIFLIVTLFSVSLTAQTAGNSGLSFLKFGFGARNVAMGDAGNALADDVTSLFYNPAKLALNSGSEIMLMHNEWIQDVRSEILGVRSEFWGIPFAFGFNVTTIDDIEVRTKALIEPEGYYSANYFFGSFSSGYKFNENFSTGFSVKYLYEGLAADEANGWALDFGVHYRSPVEGLTASAAIKNLGSMNALRNESTKLPVELRAGAAYRIKFGNDHFSAATGTDFLKYLETDDLHILFGAEVMYDDVIALRGGYQSGFESKSFTGGVGLKWGNLGVDYAIQPFLYGLGSTNLFSIQFRF